MDSDRAKKRSYNMSQIRGKDTKPELFVRRLLWSMGYRYRLHQSNLPGKPDIVFIGKRKVIFINGCFWHKHECPDFVWPKSNASFWREKIEGNVARDKLNQTKLLDNDWTFLIIWECAIKEIQKTGMDKKLNEFTASLNRFLDKDVHNPMEIDRSGLKYLENHGSVV